MAVPPKFAAHKFAFNPSSASTSHATHTLELYVDYCCPFSAKLYKTLNTIVPSVIQANQTFSTLLPAFILRPMVQPWHPSSTLMHEAALAVLRLSPDKFRAFSTQLFQQQTEFFDVNVVNETRNQTYRRLAKVAGQVGVDEEKVYKLLEISDKPSQDGALNVGNEVTNDLKLLTKMSRLVGVHVTPTVVFNGVVQDVSSSWGEEQWKEWLTKNVV